MKSLSGSSTTLGNIIHSILLILEVSGLNVPLVDFCRDRVKGHNLFYERGRNSSDKEANEDVVINDTGVDDIALGCGDITLKCGGELSVLFDHSLGG